MSDFKFIEIPNENQWVISAPKRASRPESKKKTGCVFCPKEDPNNIELEKYRIGGEKGDPHWKIRVIQNKFPFAPIHDVVILTPEHVKHLSDVNVERVRLGIETYVNRYNTYKKDGNVTIFGNAGHGSGESIGHPHAQIAVTPQEVALTVPRLEKEVSYRGEHFVVGEFELICPPYSQWPDEVWIIPQERGKTFGEVSYKEIESLSYVWHRIIKIFEIRHGHTFPHNFYIYPFSDWYLRIIPRAKIPGGFELATGVFVNTQDPHETMSFIKEHFAEAEEKKIRKNRAKYRWGV